MTADRPAKKDLWDRFQIAAQVVAAVFIPIALAAGSAIVSRSLQKQEHGTKMIELALDVLRSDPGTAGQQDGLRGWAVDLLAEYSDTPISDSARQRLLARPLPSFQRTVDVLSTLKGGESIEERALASGALNSIFLNAVESGNRNLVAQLLSAGLSPNTADPDGTTALTHAALVGDDNITALLLQANANPNLANKTGDTPLIIASRGGSCHGFEATIGCEGDRDQSQKLRPSVGTGDCEGQQGNYRRADGCRCEQQPTRCGRSSGQTVG